MPRSRNALGEAVCHGAAFALLWLLLGGDPVDSWVVGIPTVLIAVAASRRLGLSLCGSVRWRAVPAFALFMLVEMVRGAVLTVRLVLLPRGRLQPGFMTLPLGLSGETARVLLTNAVNLVPGTVSVTREGDVLTIHVLDLGLPVAEELRHLEGRVAAVFQGSAG